MPEKWVLDRINSELSFKIRHLLVGVSGSFNEFEVGMCESQKDHPEFKFEAHTASVQTGIRSRDDHLRTPEFFDCEKYPYMKFYSTECNYLEPHSLEITGVLQIKAVDLPVTINAKREIFFEESIERQCVFTMETQLSRSACGFLYNGKTSDDEPILGDSIKIKGRFHFEKED